MIDGITFAGVPDCRVYGYGYKKTTVEITLENSLSGKGIFLLKNVLLPGVEAGSLGGDAGLTMIPVEVYT